jgi:hypothetical protein
MSTNPPADLEEAIRQSGEGWLIDRFAPPSEAISIIRRTLGEIDRQGKARLGENAPDLSESALLAEYKRNPQRVRGFFQALGVSGTPEMLLMAWRIIQGMEIKSVELTYLRQQSFQMKVVLESPDGKEDKPYNSENINDFKIFRHIGIMKIERNPVFDGFYPLNVRG